MLGMYGLGTQELIIAGVVLVVLVFAPFLFAFARAGFRHPLLTAIPVSIAVFLVVALAAGFTGVNALAILAIIAIAAIVYGFARSVIRTSDNKSDAASRKASSATNEASTLDEAQPTDLSEDVSGQVAEKASVEIPLSPSTSGPSAPKPLLLPVSRLFARGRKAFTKRPETLELAAFFGMVGLLMLIGVLFQGIITPPQMGTLTYRIKQAARDYAEPRYEVEGFGRVDEREKAIIDRHKSELPSGGLLQKVAAGRASLEIENRRQQRAYAEKPPTTIAQITVAPARKMLSNLGDRRQVLGIIRKMTPEQREEALKLAPGVGQRIGDDRVDVFARCVAAFSRGVTHGWVNPIMELVGIGGTEKEIQFIRQLDEIATQEFHPYRPGDPWSERVPLQAIEMLPWVFVIGGLIFIAYRWKARSAQMKHAEARSTPTVVPGRDSSSEIYKKPGNAMPPSDSGNCVGSPEPETRIASREEYASPVAPPTKSSVSQSETAERISCGIIILAAFLIFGLLVSFITRGPFWSSFLFSVVGALWVFTGLIAIVIGLVSEQRLGILARFLFLGLFPISSMFVIIGVLNFIGSITGKRVVGETGFAISIFVASLWHVCVAALSWLTWRYLWTTVDENDKNKQCGHGQPRHHTEREQAHCEPRQTYQPRKTKNAEQSPEEEDRQAEELDGAQNNSGRLTDERYYASVLGIAGRITPDEVRRKYHDLSMMYHPDHVSHLGIKLQETAAREMKAIDEAYDYFKKKYGM